MKFLSTFLLINLILFSSQSFSSENTEPKGNSLFCPDSTNQDKKFDNNCLVASVVSLTMVYNLYSYGSNMGKENPKEAKYSTARTAYEGLCVGRVSDSVWQKMHSLQQMDAKARANAASDPNGFVGAAWKQYKDRVRKKKWDQDLLPKLASNGYKKIVAGSSLEIGAGLVEELAKERIADKKKVITQQDKIDEKNGGMETYAKLNVDLLCEDAVQKALNNQVFNKPGALGSLLKLANSANKFTGDMENKLFYADIVTKFALDGGDKAKDFYNETLTPLMSKSKYWTNTQKIKAQNIKDSFKDFLSKKKSSLGKRAAELKQTSESKVAEAKKNATSKAIEIKDDTKEYAVNAINNSKKSINTLVSNARDNISTIYTDTEIAIEKSMKNAIFTSEELLRQGIILTNKALYKRKEILARIDDINKEYSSVKDNMLLIIKDGEHFPLESKMRKYTEFLRVQLAKMDLDHKERISELEHKFKNIAEDPNHIEKCFESEDENSQEIRILKKKLCNNETPSEKKGKIATAKEKIKNVFSGIKNKFKRKEKE